MKLNKYNVETNHGQVVIVGTDEQDARTMAEKAGYKTFSASIIIEEKTEQSGDYLSWCKKIGVEPC